MDTVRPLSVNAIRGDPNQPRQRFPEAPLRELASNIAEHGVLEPIIVRPDPDKKESYIVIAGERRLRATRMAGMKTIPSLIRTDFDKDKIVEVAIAENVARMDLNPMEEARAFQGRLEAGLDIDTVARKVGRSAKAVRDRLLLLTLLPELQDLIEKGHLFASSGVAVSRLTPEYQGKALHALSSGHTTHEGFIEFCRQLEIEQSEQSVFGQVADAPKERTKEEVKVRQDLDKGIDLAIAALARVMDKKTFDILPAAIAGDADLLSHKLRMLARECKRLETKIEAIQIRNKVG